MGDFSSSHGALAGPKERGLARRGGEPGEFGQREGLGAPAGVDRGGLDEPAGALRPEPQAGGQGVRQALATLAEGGPHHRGEAGRIGHRDGRRTVRDRWSTAESTWGGGLKAPGGTEKARRAATDTWVSTES